MRTVRLRWWLLAIVLIVSSVGSMDVAHAEPVPPGSVAIIGDFGSGTAPERQVADLVASVRPRVVVTTGDNVYSDAGYPRLVGGYYGSWVRSGTLLPATGNHDYAEGIEAFDAYFTGLHGRRWYSRTVQGVEFFVLDSEAMLQSRAQFDQQRAWLARAMPRSTADWQVVVLHHPPYSSGSVHGSSASFRWPFAQWGADLVLSGHDHDYERLHVGGLDYVVNGSGGRSLYPLGKPLRGSVVRNATDFGALFLSPSPTVLTGRFLATDGHTLDRFAIMNSR